MSDFPNNDGLQQAMDIQSSSVISRKHSCTDDDSDSQDDNAANNNQSGTLPAASVIAPTTSGPAHKNLFQTVYAKKSFELINSWRLTASPHKSVFHLQSIF